MGMKLKSGADLCGFELSRFCVQNDVAIPDAPASGRKYFHTGTGMEGKYSLLGRERIFTGTSWRATAYVDDLANLDITSNADFQELQKKVNAFLDGEVDSDGVLDNLKEIQKFLDNYSSATDLTDILNTKLDKSGGTISGELTVDGNFGLTGYISTRNHYLFVRNNDNAEWVVTNKNWNSEYILLHSGNVGDYALKTDGSNEMKEALFLNFSNPRIVFKSGSTVYGSFGYVSGDLKWFNGADNAYRTIAFTDSNVASARALVHSNGKEGAAVDNYGNIACRSSIVNSSDSWYVGSIGSAFGNDEVGMMLYSYQAPLYLGNSGKVRMLINSSGNVTIGAGDFAMTEWKHFVEGNAFVYGYSTRPALGEKPESSFSVGYHSNGRVLFGLHTWLETSGDALMQVGRTDGTATAYNLVLNPLGGNVLIGTTTGIGHSTAKMQAYNATNEWASILYTNNAALMVSHRDGYGAAITSKSNNAGRYLLSIRYNDSSLSGSGNLAVSVMDNGNVGIGTSNPSAQLHVSQDIVANGTIACKGVAAEGSAPVGTVDKWAGSIATGTKSQTYTHGLGTTDITVAIYEKNGNEWVQILTDVDIVNTNSIRVTFGANTTVEHRIVVMG